MADKSAEQNKKEEEAKKRAKRAKRDKRVADALTAELKGIVDKSGSSLSEAIHRDDPEVPVEKKEKKKYPEDCVFKKGLTDFEKLVTRSNRVRYDLSELSKKQKEEFNNPDTYEFWRICDEQGPKAAEKFAKEKKVGLKDDILDNDKERQKLYTTTSETANKVLGIKKATAIEPWAFLAIVSALGLAVLLIYLGAVYVFGEPNHRPPVGYSSLFERRLDDFVKQGYKIRQAVTLKDSNETFAMNLNSDIKFAVVSDKPMTYSDATGVSRVDSSFALDIGSVLAPYSFEVKPVNEEVNLCYLEWQGEAKDIFQLAIGWSGQIFQTGDNLFTLVVKAGVAIFVIAVFIYLGFLLFINMRKLLVRA